MMSITLKRSAIIALTIGISTFSQAQEESTKRKPASMLPASMAAMLLSEGREELEQPEKTLDKMGLKDGDLVADIGCGNGFYSLRVAQRIAPHGAVFAVDVQQGMLDQMQKRQADAEIRNIYPVLGEFTDPNLPPGKIDWVLLVDAYHEFGEPEAMLEKIKGSLAPNGKVALLEYRAEQDKSEMPEFIPRDHKMTIDEVMSEWVPAGFELVERLEFLPAQHLFIFEASRITAQAVGSTKNASTYNDKVFFGGQPSADDLKLYADKGIHTVINIRMPQEMDQLGFDEKAAATKLGLTYVHAPMAGQLAQGDTLEAMLTAIDDARMKGPVLIHCASSNRVGAVWAAYRGIKSGLSVEDALAEGKAAGMRAPTFTDQVREAIDNK